MTWETVPLGALVHPVSGRAGSEDLPVYSVTKHAGFVPSREYFKKQVFSADLTTYKVVEPEQFAYATIHLDEGSIGIAPERCLISPMYTVFSADRNRVHPPYLLRYLKSPTGLAEYPRLGRGTAERRKSISLSTLGSLRVPLPPLTEQRRIAAILDEADALRTLHRGSLENLERLRVAHFETSFANARFAPTVIADVVAEVPNALRTGPFGSDLLHSEFVDDGVPVLGIDNVVSNEFVWAKPRFITQEKYESLKRYTVRGGDVLITIMGTVGRCGVVPDDIDQAINTKHLCCITLDQSRCLPDYLHDYFLYHPTAREYLRKTAKGAVMDGLNMGIIKQMPIVLPSIEAQHHYVSQITEVSTLADTAKSRDVDTLFASLQHRAFRGEL